MSPRMGTCPETLAAPFDTTDIALGVFRHVGAEVRGQVGRADVGLGAVRADVGTLSFRDVIQQISDHAVIDIDKKSEISQECRGGTYLAGMRQLMFPQPRRLCISLPAPRPGTLELFLRPRRRQ